MVVETTITSIADYTEKICQMNRATCECSPVHDEVLLFRGQANKEYELVPAIGRNGRALLDEERNLIEMAKYRLPDIFKNDLLPVELLALLQHHGIPTRLLDVTENALVALYFACCGNTDTDGEVIVFKHDNSDVTNYPVVNAIADSYRFTRSFTDLSTFYAAVKNQPYFAEQREILNLKHPTDLAGGKWIEECCQRIHFIYAPARSLRQQVQQGRYILFHNQIVTKVPQDAFWWPQIEPIPKNHPDILLRIIIYKKIKQQLLQDLSVLGITESFLFCDNIDTVCKGIVDTFDRKLKRRTEQ